MVGGKAANLSRLASAFSVPPGFCLTGETSQVVAEANRDALLSQVEAHYRDLCSRSGDPNVAVAVRSSAIDEDSADASFAGQNETFLNIRGPEAVVASVSDCVASFTSARAQAYREQHGLATDAPRFAVLVQQLVNADTSGVVFSLDPLGQHDDEIVINASWGLGESIVGGSVTPDNYFAEPAGHRMTRSDVSTKERMTVAIGAGTREVGVPERLRGVACLSPVQVTATASLACDLEQAMGWPVDAEFAWTADQLYLLQCRPVTTAGRTTNGLDQERTA
ncbi:hypothetical protein GCM10027344_35960 [Spelaeicoccus albus]